MIHRFVDLLDEAVVTPIVPLMVTVGTGSNTTRVYTIGEGLPPFQISSQAATGTGGSFVSDPRLNPNEDTIVYGYTVGGASPTGRIRVATVDAVTVTTVRTGMSIFSSGLALGTCWSPDGSEIGFIVPPTSSGGNWSVAKMNADGTGYTVLYTVSTALSGVTMRGLSWSPSGDYIAAETVRNPSGADLIHVVKTDGTGGAVVFTGPTGTNNGSAVSPPAWQHGADVLGFSIFPGTGSNTFRTINADGTGLTTIYTDASRIYWAVDRMSWLSDDSALVALKQVSTNWELSTIDAGGGGPTDSGITLSPTAQPVKRPFVMITSREAPRIYYTTQPSPPVRTVSSVLEDFSDVRVDWDGNTFSAVTQEHGVFEFSTQ